jgi:hypothetical protein
MSSEEGCVAEIDPSWIVLPCARYLCEVSQKIRASEKEELTGPWLIHCSPSTNTDTMASQPGTNGNKRFFRPDTSSCLSIMSRCRRESQGSKNLTCSFPAASGVDHLFIGAIFPLKKQASRIDVRLQPLKLSSSSPVQMHARWSLA